MRRFAFAILALVLVGGPAAQAQGLVEHIEAVFQNPVSGDLNEDQRETVAAVQAIYQARGMQPFWVDETGAGPRAEEIYRLLLRAEMDGLQADDYGAAVTGTLLTAADGESLATLEVRLSLGLVQFASDLGEGRSTPHIADPELFLYRDKVDKSGVLLAAETADDLALLLDFYRPQSPRYDRLVSALADYRAMAELGGWQPIPDGPVLKPGMSDPRVRLIRQRLTLWGDLADDADLALAGGDPDLYDDALVAAVVRMQYRHGLAQDGVVGRQTLAAFNVSVEDRIDQMVLNLERRRWMPDDLGRRHVFVNLADFTLKVVDGERTIHDTAVVVGLPYRRTPVFSDRITYLEVNPYWHVPMSIARRDLLPKIQSDPGFLASNNYTLYSDWSASATELDPNTIDWSTVTPQSFGYKLRQGPGDGNALGRFKFMFPNRFSVYLHDTPARSLFQRAQRSFSSGCIRVQDPELLAEILLSDMPDWTLDRINATVVEGSNTVVSLPEPVPVHLSYLTAWVNKDGSVHFRSDIYDRDVELAEALMGTRVGRTF